MICQTGLKPAKNAERNIFQTFFHLNTKSVDCVRTIVDVVWPCSRVKPQKAREKCLCELTWVEPAIQSKTSIGSAVNFKKTADLAELQA